METGILQPEKSWLCQTRHAPGFQGWVCTVTIITCNRVGLRVIFGAGKGLRIDDRNSHDHAASEMKN